MIGLGSKRHVRRKRDYRRARIGIVSHGVHDDGGQERAVAELIRRIHSRFDIVVFSSELCPDLRPLVTWRRVPAPTRPAPLRFVLFYVLAGVRLASERLALLHANGPIVPQRLDLATIHCCHAASRQVAGLAPPGAPPLRRLNTGLAQLVSILAERWSYRFGRTQLLAPVSAGVARELRRHYPGIPTVITPNGVDRERFQPNDRVRAELRAEHGVSPTSVVSIFVGGDWDHKGLAIAVEALARATAVGRYSGELWVLGHGDEVRIGAMARALGVERQIRFFGFRRDAERFYQASDLFVLPTRYEAFSLAAHEAASCGLPLIVTRVSGIEELVGDSDAGILAERSPEAFGQALGLLGSDVALRERMAGCARARVSRLTWDHSAAVVLEAYRRVLCGALEGAR